MKKFILCILIIMFNQVCLAQANNIEHSDKEANFKLETLSQWTNIQITKSTLENSTAFLVHFYDNLNKESPFALLVVDGRKNPDFEQTSQDFSNNNAHILLSQLVFEEKAQFEKDGYKIVSSEIKKYNNTDYIYMKLENNRTNSVILRSMTFKNSYSYSLSCKINLNNKPIAKELEKNFELILETLKPY